METTTNTTSPLATFGTMNVGDEIKIECANMKPRRVVVTAFGPNGAVYVTSGRTQREHMRGGLLKDYGLSFGLQYQPTWTQPVRTVNALRIVRRAAQRN